MICFHTVTKKNVLRLSETIGPFVQNRPLMWSSRCRNTIKTYNIKCCYHLLLVFVYILKTFQKTFLTPDRRVYFVFIHSKQSSFLHTKKLSGLQHNDWAAFYSIYFYEQLTKTNSDSIIQPTRGIWTFARNNGEKGQFPSLSFQYIWHNVDLLIKLWIFSKSLNLIFNLCDTELTSNLLRLLFLNS